MKEKELRKLKSLKTEVRNLEMRLGVCQSKEYVQDVVNDYSTGYPVKVTIEGYGDGDFPELEKKHWRRLQKVKTEVLRLETWIENLDDPIMREIFTLVYEDGFTQAEAAEILEMTRDAVAQRVSRFWRKQKGEQDG